METPDGKLSRQGIPVILSSLTLPMAKARGFLVRRPQPHVTEVTRGITQSPKAYRFGRVPPYHEIALCAGRPILPRPSVRMFSAALISRSWAALQFGQTQYRISRSFVAGFFVPQQWQICEDGKNLSTITSSFPYQTVLYASCRRTSPQEASMMLFASLRFLTRFFTERFSVQMTSFSRTSFVVIL